MLEAVFMMGGLGLVTGTCLAIASKVFYVYVDPLVEKIDELLPGANCGGCGYPGCSANAEAIVAGKSSPASCVAGGPELAEAIAGVLGVSIEAKEPDIARPGCSYGVGEAETRFIYSGLNECKAAAMLYGGSKVCEIGCLGMGTCSKACPFSAITMSPEGLPVVDEEKCTGCGTCERVCPKHIIKLSSVTRRILAEYETDDCTTPCQRSCPAGIDICGYIKKIAQGDDRGALQIIKERNPFPTVIGRICPRPCEDACRRNLIDEPVAINYLKRFAADREKDSSSRVQPYKAPSTGKRIAVVGGGVEGLSAAFFSARLGHTPVVFEAESKAGGLLRKAIADYRLPAEILDWDIEGIREIGVEIFCNKAMGREFNLPSLLKEGYDAVCVATGGWDSRLSRTKGGADNQAVPGFCLLIDVVRTGMENNLKLSIDSNTAIIAKDESLVAETISICKHLGADNITVLVKDPASIGSATREKIEKAGASIVANAAVTCIMGEQDRLHRVEYKDLLTGETFVLDAGTLIIDSGRIPEMIFTPVLPSEAKDVESTDTRLKEPITWHGILPYKDPMAGPATGLLSDADPITDYSAAIRAIAAGRRLAASIHKVIYEIPLDLPEKVIQKGTWIQRVEELSDVAELPRQIMPMANPCEIPAKYPELELGFSEEQARTEANRCLQCGVVCYLTETLRKEKLISG